MRINLGKGRWFNPESSECFEENTRWNGRNNISVATGSQWEHEELYRTRTGRWILRSWSQWQGTIPVYKEVWADWARQWLIDQGRFDDAEKFFPGSLEETEI